MKSQLVKLSDILIARFSFKLTNFYFYILCHQWRRWQIFLLFSIQTLTQLFLCKLWSRQNYALELFVFEEKLPQCCEFCVLAGSPVSLVELMYISGMDTQAISYQSQHNLSSAFWDQWGNSLSNIIMYCLSPWCIGAWSLFAINDDLL